MDKLTEKHFNEYYGKKLGGKKANTNSADPRTPHYLEDRVTAFGRSYRSMKHLDEDCPDFLKELSDHAIKIIDAQKNKKGMGKSKGKGGGAERSGGATKGGGKTKRLPSPSAEYHRLQAAAKAAAAQASGAQASGAQASGAQPQRTPFPFPAPSGQRKEDTGEGGWGKEQQRQLGIHSMGDKRRSQRKLESRKEKRMVTGKDPHP